MADRYAINKTTLDALADAVRAFKHTENTMTPEQMTAAIMAYTWPWLGDDMDQGNVIYDKTYKLKDTAFNGWAGSTTAKTIITSVNMTAFTASNMSEFEHLIVWETSADLVADAGATNKALPILMRNQIVQGVFRRPSSWANIQASNDNSNVTTSLFAANFLRYYGTTANSATYSWGVSYGFYASAVSPAISNTTSNTPNITPKAPTISARCSTTYMSTGNVQYINKDNSKIRIVGKVYRIRKRGFLRTFYDRIIEMIGTPIPTED